MRWAGLVARMGDMKNVYNIFCWKTQREGPLGRPRSIWEGNIRLDLREIGTSGEPL
jgi:hypothetical protein